MSGLGAPRPGRCGMRARRARNFLGGFFGRRASSLSLLRGPAPAAAAAAGSGVCGACIPRPRRRRESLCQELARRALPLRLGAGRAAAKSAPRAGRVLREGSSAGAGRKERNERETKGAVGFSFVRANLLTSFRLPYVTQTSKLVILFYCYDYCHHLCVSLAFLFISGPRSILKR